MEWINSYRSRRRRTQSRSSAPPNFTHSTALDVYYVRSREDVTVDYKTLRIDKALIPHPMPSLSPPPLPFWSSSIKTIDCCAAAIEKSSSAGEPLYIVSGISLYTSSRSKMLYIWPSTRRKRKSNSLSLVAVTISTQLNKRWIGFGIFHTPHTGIFFLFEYQEQLIRFSGHTQNITKIWQEDNKL